MPIYTPVDWIDEVPGEDPVTYDIEGLTAGKTIELHVAPTTGTPLNATNMNHIEHGILDATILTNRQGGSSTSWKAPGNSNYSIGQAKIQVGIKAVSIVSGVGNASATFPVAFDYAPIVIATVDANIGSSLNGKVNVTLNPSATGVGLYAQQIDGTTLTETIWIYWVAIGPYTTDVS